MSIPYKRLNGLRLPKKDCKYYEFKLEQFVEKLDPAQYDFVEFGPQSQGAAHSICLYRGSVIVHQRYFQCKNELLGYIIGVGETATTIETI